MAAGTEARPITLLEKPCMALLVMAIDGYGYGICYNG
jgi:hypothetical protein